MTSAPYHEDCKPNMFSALILLLIIANASAEIYRFRFRGLDHNYAYQPYAILLLRESIACRAGVSYDKVLLEGITGPDGHISFTSDSSENRIKSHVPVQCAIINNMHWDTSETADPVNVMELTKEPIYEYQLFVPAENVSRINYMNFLSGAVNEKYADVLAVHPHSFYDGQPYPVSNHRPVIPAVDERSNISLIFMIVIVEMTVILGLRYIINCFKKKSYMELSQVVVEPVIINTGNKRRYSGLNVV
jgi:hypothetical protein